MKIRPKTVSLLLSMKGHPIVFHCDATSLMKTVGGRYGKFVFLSVAMDVFSSQLLQRVSSSSLFKSWLLLTV